MVAENWLRFRATVDRSLAALTPAERAVLRKRFADDPATLARLDAIDSSAAR